MAIGLKSRAKGNALEAYLDTIRPALESMTVNVFVADLELTLVYANSEALKTLTKIGSEIEAAFGLRVDQLVGGSIHRFHRNAQHVESVLHEEGNFRLPHIAEMGFGRVHLRTNIAALHDTRGTQVGYIVNWDDVSDVKQAEERVEDLRMQLESAAAAVEEMSASISTIAQSAAEAANIASQAVSDAQGANDAVVKLRGESSMIGSDLNAISSVADQTKLLAINAAIESAKAGEVGRGFAVVASEVKELADGTAKVTATVNERMGTIGEHADHMNDVIAKVVDVIHRINDNQANIAGAVEEQSVVCAELAERINGAVENSLHLH